MAANCGEDVIPTEDAAAVCRNVPVEIKPLAPSSLQGLPRQGGLADLAGAGDEGHLAMAGQVLPQDRLAGALEAVIHGGPFGGRS